MQKMKESGSLTPAHLRGLMAFSAAARTLNFSRAAQEAGCTASVLSRRIAALERHIGGPLFLRSTRRVALTPLGESLLARATGLESALEELNAELSRQHAEPAGRVRLHLPTTYGRRCVAPLLPELLARYPRLQLDVTFDDAYVDLIAARVDLALRIGTPPDSGLIARGLRPIRRFVCASPRYLATAPALARPSDLQRHRCIALQTMRSGDLWAFHRGQERERVRVEPVFRCNNADAMRHAVLAGTGVALLSDFVVGDAVADGRLVELLPDWSLPQPAVQLLWVAGADRAPRVRAVIDFLSAHLRD